MGRTIMVEERMSRLDEGIAKAYSILDEYPPRVSFTPEEYMKYYDCVYHMCIDQHSARMLERFVKALQESILVKVVPTFCDKEGAPLLAQFLHMWSNYKAMSKSLGIFFLYLDREFDRKKSERLEDVATRQFRDHVCKPFQQKLFSAAVSLITQDRNGQLIDRDLLQNIAAFFVEIGESENASYYVNFESVILVNTAGYYSCLATQWLLCHSSTEYILKVDQCLNQEKERASHFLFPSSVEKLLKIVHLHLVDLTANKLNEKRIAENQDSTTLQDMYESSFAFNLVPRKYPSPGLLSRCANLRIQ